MLGDLPTNMATTVASSVQNLLVQPFLPLWTLMGILLIGTIAFGAMIKLIK